MFHLQYFKNIVLRKLNIWWVFFVGGGIKTYWYSVIVIKSSVFSLLRKFTTYYQAVFRHLLKFSAYIFSKISINKLSFKRYRVQK